MFLRRFLASTVSGAPFRKQFAYLKVYLALFGTLNIWRLTVLDAFNDPINILQRLALGLRLEEPNKGQQGKSPASIHDICLPASASSIKGAAKTKVMPEPKMVNVFRPMPNVRIW
ncbi:hypothetical protein V2G26_010817 [Clonostachys chloroleuca]